MSDKYDLAKEAARLCVAGLPLAWNPAAIGAARAALGQLPSAVSMEARALAPRQETPPASAPPSSPRCWAICHRPPPVTSGRRSKPPLAPDLAPAAPTPRSGKPPPNRRSWKSPAIRGCFWRGRRDSKPDSPICRTNCWPLVREQGIVGDAAMGVWNRHGGVCAPRNASTNTGRAWPDGIGAGGPDEYRRTGATRQDRRAGSLGTRPESPRQRALRSRPPHNRGRGREPAGTGGHSFSRGAGGPKPHRPPGRMGTDAGKSGGYGTALVNARHVHRPTAPSACGAGACRLGVGGLLRRPPALRPPPGQRRPRGNPLASARLRPNARPRYCQTLVARPQPVDVQRVRSRSKAGQGQRRKSRNPSVNSRATIGCVRKPVTGRFDAR